MHQNNVFTVNFNLFQVNVPFLYPLKTSENQRFSDAFRGYKKGALTWNRLIRFSFLSYLQNQFFFNSAFFCTVMMFIWSIKWNSHKESLAIHCIKSVEIRSYFCYIFFCIWTEYRKIRTRKNFVFGHFSRSDSYSKDLDWICTCYGKLWQLIFYQKFNDLTWIVFFACRTLPSKIWVVEIALTWLRNVSGSWYMFVIYYSQSS